MDVRFATSLIALVLAFSVLAEDTADDGFCVGVDDCEDNGSSGERVKSVEAPVYREPLGITVKAYFAMACFWGVEAAFGCQPGVVRVRAGYMGGEKDSPTYKDLGDHTETVEVEYDPYKTKYSKLLEVFWKYHDYSAEYKTQYMSAIFYQDDEQRSLAELGKAEREEKEEHVATKILPAKKFYKAEDYHQKYFLREHTELVSELGLSDEDFMHSSRASRLLCYLAGPGEEADFIDEAVDLGLNKEQIRYITEKMKTKIFTGCEP